MNARTSGLLLVLAGAAACGSARGTGSDECPEGWTCTDLDTRPFGGVDILVVVDNSREMSDEQIRLSEELPGLVLGLLDPAPGVPILDLHLGVVSTDMGAGGYLSSCTNRGDEGVLRTEPDTSATGCDPAYDPYFAGAAPDAALEWAACMTQIGTAGCGMEMPLESAYQALTRQSEPEGPNAGFLREDTTLAVFFLAGEDDCSALDYSLFDFTDTSLGLLDTRCINHPGYLHPVSRYIEGLASVREGRWPIVMGLVAGVPPGEDACSGTGDAIAGCLDLEEMVPSSTLEPGNIDPVCMTATSSYPPTPRLVELAVALGRDAFVQSICEESLEPVLDGLAGRIVELVDEACDLPLLDMTKDGSDPCLCNSTCRVVHVLAYGGPCPAGLVAWDTGGSHVTACESPQAGTRLGSCDLGCLDEGQTTNADGSGWYVGASPGASCPAMAFTAGTEPPAGAQTFVACP